jgi:hypothetical protein
MSQKAKYIKNVNFLPKKAILGYLMLIFTVCKFFITVFLIFNIPFMYRVIFFGSLSWPKVRGEFLSKE